MVLMTTSTAAGINSCTNIDRDIESSIEDEYVVEIPNDGTWDYQRMNETGTDLAGFGEWTIENHEVDSRYDHFSYKIDSPPVVENASFGLKITSEIHVKRVGEGYVPLALDDLYASLTPGVSMTDEDGNFRYDEAYGRADIACEADELEVGEQTVCTLSYIENSHPEWLQDSYWVMHFWAVGTWPSQTEG
ncbi:MAG: hypothetical protein ACTHXA_02300 [Gulosibacter sp.]|uniref:hypothetical protein n=1 Tax=Gulosibacter sp. TaxID=2817531 RepID=UPI003F91815D